MSLRLVLSVFAIFGCATAALRAGVATGDRTVPLSGASHLRLNVNGDASLVPDPAARAIVIRATSGNPAVRYSLGITRTGSRLTLSIAGPRPAVLPFAGASGAAYQITYPATLPLDVREYGGNLTMNHPLGPVDLYCASGNVSIDRPEATVTAEVNDGNITVDRARSNVDIASDNGNVHADIAARWAGDSIRMQASNGNIVLDLPSPFRGRFDLSTGRGSVMNAFRSDPRGVPVFMLARAGNVTVEKNSRP